MFNRIKKDLNCCFVARMPVLNLALFESIPSFSAHSNTLIAGTGNNTTLTLIPRSVGVAKK